MLITKAAMIRMRPWYQFDKINKKHRLRRYYMKDMVFELFQQGLN